MPYFNYTPLLMRSAIHLQLHIHAKHSIIQLYLLCHKLFRNSYIPREKKITAWHISVLYFSNFVLCHLLLYIFLRLEFCHTFSQAHLKTNLPIVVCICPFFHLCVAEVSFQLLEIDAKQNSYYLSKLHPYSILQPVTPIPVLRILRIFFKSSQCVIIHFHERGKGH